MSVIYEPGKPEIKFRNSDVAKFGTRDERKTKLTEYIYRRGPRVYEKSTEAKILSNTKEFTNEFRKAIRRWNTANVIRQAVSHLTNLILLAQWK